MTTQKLTWTALLVAAGVFTVGCGDDGGGTTPEGTAIPERDFVCPSTMSAPCETMEPRRQDAARTIEIPEGDETFEFVLREIDIPGVDGGRAPGFNLDGWDSGMGDLTAGCRDSVEDFTAIRDPGHVGVDNFLATLLPTLEGLLGMVDGIDCGASTSGCLGREATRQIGEGDLLILGRVTGWNGTANDDAVQVQLFLGEPIPEMEDDPMTDGAGLVAAGQTFTIAQSISGTSPIAGTVLDGRVAVSTPSLPLSLDFEGTTFTIALGQTEVRMDMPVDGGDVAANGAIGGALPLEELASQARALLGDDPDTQMLVETVVNSLNSDIDLSNPADGTCEGISVGLHFSAVAAVLEGG